jgi:hypothetical protein
MGRRTMSPPPQPNEAYGDPRGEALTLIRQATAEGVTLRVTGGVAVALRCASAASPPLMRSYKDLDLVGTARQRDAIDALMKGSGFRANEEFNALHGHHQLLYVDARGRVLDVFIDRIVMCHALDVSDRLDLHEHTLSPADLLLTKLQVIETNESDLKDAVALLADCELDLERVVSVLTADWGWWRTATQVLRGVRSFNDGLEDFALGPRVSDRIAELEDTIAAAPKGLKWRLRARVGDRVIWYQTPETEE